MSHCSALQALNASVIEQSHGVNFVVLFIKMIRAQTCGPIYMKHSLLVSIRQLLGWNIISIILYNTLK